MKILFLLVVFTTNLFAQSFKSNYAHLKKIVLESETELKDRICRNWTAEYHEIPMYDSPNYLFRIGKCESDFILSARICRGASFELRRILAAQFPDLNFKVVTTIRDWNFLYHGPERFLTGEIVPGGEGLVRGIQSYSHTFIIVEDYFGSGVHLYIDPTYTQNFINTSNRDEVSRKPIFVGKFEELKSILLSYSVKDIENYLITMREPEPALR